jgi:hypothetical protein
VSVKKGILIIFKMKGITQCLYAWE